MVKILIFLGLKIVEISTFALVIFGLTWLFNHAEWLVVALLVVGSVVAVGLFVFHNWDLAGQITNILTARGSDEN